MRVRGVFHTLLLYDVAESLNLESLRSRLGPKAERAQPIFPRGTPQYVRLEQPPIVEPGEPFAPDIQGRGAISLKYYGFGAAVVEWEAPFEADWNQVAGEFALWMESADSQPRARRILKNRLDQVAPGVARPTEEWLEETYYVIELRAATAESGAPLSGADLLSGRAADLMQIMRGETAPLSPRAAEEAPLLSLSYYASDLVVVGSSSALVYDSPDEAAATIRVLEYARMQLLEFRYYDGLMTRLLADVYSAQERKRNVLFSRWTLPREAKRVNTIRLDVMELTERIDNAIKFVSDVYYARLYQLAATRMGVSDYRNLVESKLRTVGELYDFMMDQFNEARSFVLELIIVVLFVVEVVIILRQK